MARASALLSMAHSCWRATTAASRSTRRSATSAPVSPKLSLRNCMRSSASTPSTSRSPSMRIPLWPRTSRTSGSSHASSGKSRRRIWRSARDTRPALMRSMMRTVRASVWGSRALSSSGMTRSRSRRRGAGWWWRCIRSRRAWRRIRGRAWMMISSIDGRRLGGRFAVCCMVREWCDV